MKRARPRWYPSASGTPASPSHSTPAYIDHRKDRDRHPPDQTVYPRPHRQSAVRCGAGGTRGALPPPRRARCRCRDGARPRVTFMQKESLGAASTVCGDRREPSSPAPHWRRWSRGSRTCEHHRQPGPAHCARFFWRDLALQRSRLTKLRDAVMGTGKSVVTSLIIEGCTPRYFLNAL